MRGRSSLAHRLALTAALAAAMTGALLGLAGAVFATFVGHPPSPLTLALVVAAVALASALAAIVVLARAPGVRRAVGLDPARRGGPEGSPAWRAPSSCPSAPGVAAQGDLLEPLSEDDPPGGLDEREVGERLREVAEVPRVGGVELLGVEAER